MNTICILDLHTVRIQQLTFTTTYTYILHGALQHSTHLGMPFRLALTNTFENELKIVEVEKSLQPFLPGLAFWPAKAARTLVFVGHVTR